MNVFLLAANTEEAANAGAEATIDFGAELAKMLGVSTPLIAYIILAAIALVYVVGLICIMVMAARLAGLKKANRKLEELIDLNTEMIEELKKRPNNRPQMPARPPMPPMPPQHGNRW